MRGSLLGRLLFVAFALGPLPAVSGGNPSSIKLNVQAEIPIGGDHFGFGFDALWTMDGPKLFRIDAKDNTITSFLIEGATGEVRGIVAGQDAIWLPDVGSQKIYKFDPKSHAVRLEIYVDMYGREGSIGIGEGSVWAVTINDRVLERFSADTGKLEASIALPSDGVGVIVESGSVWVSGNLKGELYRIDPRSNTIAEIIRLHAMPRLMTFGFGSIWVMNAGDATVQRIDALTGRVLATIALGQTPSPGDIAMGKGFIWVTMPGLPLAQIDPNTNSIVGIFGPPTYTTGYHYTLRYGAGSLWVSGPAIRRVEPPAAPP